MVWARFLSTYNNKYMKTVLSEQSIIAYSPHPFFYVYSVPTHIIMLISLLYVYLSHCPSCPYGAQDFCHVKKKWVEKIQQKGCHNCYRHKTTPFDFLGNIHGNGQPHGILWEPYVYLQTPLWEGIPLTIKVPPPSGPTRYEGEIDTRVVTI